MEAVFDSRTEALESGNLVVLIYWAGEYARALALVEAETTTALSRGQLARAARCWACAATCQAALGDLGAARDAVVEAQDLAARVGQPNPTVLYAQEALTHATGEPSEELGATVAAVSGSGNPAISWALGNLYAMSARIALSLGEDSRALALVGRLLPWLERAPAWTIGLSLMAGHASEILWRLERLDHVATLQRALVEKVLPPDFRTPMADARLALARLCALQGRHDEALGWFDEARRVLSEQGARPLLAIVDYDQALMYCRRGEPRDPDRGKPLLDAARHQFETIGMSGWIRRADELRGRLSTR
jgi:tetratricopeptide (TPR) repeat protein